MKITNEQVASTLEDWAPPSIAENYDNVGLLVGEKEKEVTGILTCLDITIDVLEEALKKKCNLVVSHHPIWFRNRKNLLGDDFPSQVLLFAIRKEISIYACHTNLDNIEEGVNQSIAKKLGLENISFLENKTSPSSPCSFGNGMLGDLPQTLGLEELLSTLKKTFHSQGIRYAKANKEKIQKIAICGGAGTFLLPLALEKKADAFITADISYHNFFETCQKLYLIDIGHYESEQFTGPLLSQKLKEAFSNFKVLNTSICTNPIHYY